MPNLRRSAIMCLLLFLQLEKALLEQKYLEKLSQPVLTLV